MVEIHITSEHYDRKWVVSRGLNGGLFPSQCAHAVQYKSLAVAKSAWNRSTLSGILVAMCGSDAEVSFVEVK